MVTLNLQDAGQRELLAQAFDTAAKAEDGLYNGLRRRLPHVSTTAPTIDKMQEHEKTATAYRELRDVLRKVK